MCGVIVFIIVLNMFVRPKDSQCIQVYKKAPLKWIYSQGLAAEILPGHLGLLVFSPTCSVIVIVIIKQNSQFKPSVT